MFDLLLSATAKNAAFVSFDAPGEINRAFGHARGKEAARNAAARGRAMA